MASVYDVVAALQVMGLELKALGDEAVKTVAKVKEATAGIKNAPDVNVAVESIATTSLGDPRNAEDQMVGLYNAIEAAKRGR